MKISRDDAHELCCGDVVDGWDFVASVSAGKHRWYTLVLIVLRSQNSGTLWGFYFEEAATESQENGELPEWVELFPVEAVQETTYRRLSK